MIQMCGVKIQDIITVMFFTAILYVSIFVESNWFNLDLKGGKIHVFLFGGYALYLLCRNVNRIVRGKNNTLYIKRISYVYSVIALIYLTAIVVYLSKTFL